MCKRDVCTTYITCNCDPWCKYGVCVSYVYIAGYCINKDKYNTVRNKFIELLYLQCIILYLDQAWDIYHIFSVCDRSPVLQLGNHKHKLIMQNKPNTLMSADIYRLHFKSLNSAWHVGSQEARAPSYIPHTCICQCCPLRQKPVENLELKYIKIGNPTPQQISS